MGPSFARGPDGRLLFEAPSSASFEIQELWVTPSGGRSRRLDHPAVGRYARRVTDSAVFGPCVPGEETLCLHGSRFEVKTAYRNHIHGGSGTGRAAPLDFSADSGAFWFFDETNLELMVKVLDATTVNGHIWVFSGSMTDVEYTLPVTDTLTGEDHQYFHPPGSLCGQANVAAF